MKKAIPLAFTFIGLTLAIVAVPPQIETLRIANEARSFESTGAEVLVHREESHGKGPATRLVEFEYVVDGELYRGDNHLTQFTDTKEKVESLIRENDKGREFVQVYYDPDNPERVILHRDIELWVPIGVLLATALCLYIGISGYLERRRIRKRRERFRSSD